MLANQKLNQKHLLTLSLKVDTSQSYQVGDTPNGKRLIVPVTGGSFEGDRLNGKVDTIGYDWVRFRPDGVMEIDVRLALRTHDGAAIYLSYQGRLIASPDVHKRMASREEIALSEYSLTVIAKFETGAEQYHWLNNVIAVGEGRQFDHQPQYEIYEVGR